MAEFKTGVVSDAVVLEIADNFVSFLLKGLHEFNPMFYYTMAWAAKKKPAIFKGILVGGAATVGQIWRKTTGWLGIFQGEDNPIQEMVEDGLAKGPQAVERHFEKNVVVLPADFVPPSDDDLEAFLKEHWEGFLAHALELLTHSREWVDRHWNFSWWMDLLLKLQEKLQNLNESLEARNAPRRDELSARVEVRRSELERSLRHKRARLAAELALRRR